MKLKLKSKSKSKSKLKLGCRRETKLSAMKKWQEGESHTHRHTQTIHRHTQTNRAQSSPGSPVAPATLKRVTSELHNSLTAPHSPGGGSTPLALAVSGLVLLFGPECSIFGSHPWPRLDKCLGLDYRCAGLELGLPGTRNNFETCSGQPTTKLPTMYQLPTTNYQLPTSF